MSRAFATYLVASGLAAAAVIAFPAFIVVGLLLGILPGIALVLMPTVFLYSVLWWGVRWLLLRAFAHAPDARSRSMRVILGLAAAAIVAVAVSALPPWLNAATQRQAAALRAEDKSHDGPLVLPSVVAVVMPNVYDRREGLVACEEVCQRLLFNRAASRVIMSESLPPGSTERAGAMAYWIERRETCPEPGLNRRQIRWPNDFPLKRGEDPRSRVLARIAAGECLVHAEARIEEADATISYRTVKSGETMFRGPWSLWLDTVTGHRLEVADESARVLYRRTEVRVQPLATPLRIGPGFGLLTTVTYAGWARERETYAPIGPNGRDVLPALLGDAGRVPVMAVPKD